MPKHGNSKVQNLPYDKDGNLIPVLDEVKPEEVFWKPNRIFYDTMKIEGRRRVGYYTSKSLSLTSLTTGRTYRLMGDSVMRLLLNGVIIRGTIEGYWIGTRAGGDFYGLRWIEEEKAPKRLVERVKAEIQKTATPEQVWRSTGRSLRVEDGGTTVRSLTEDGKAGLDQGPVGASDVRDQSGRVAAD